jgi:hypothetical protein
MALTERYFGSDMRSTLELVIMPKFADINELAHDIYFFNIEMLKRIQERRIGQLR